MDQPKPKELPEVLQKSHKLDFGFRLIHCPSLHTFVFQICHHYVLLSLNDIFILLPFLNSHLLLGH